MNKGIMEKKEYLSPSIQVIEVENSCCIMQASGKDNTGGVGPGGVITNHKWLIDFLTFTTT